MTNNQNQPREFDAVLGGDNPIITDVVLGGIKGIIAVTGLMRYDV
jgi:hypothetical protein